MEKLHPGARWLFRLKSYMTIFFMGIVLFFVSMNLFTIFRLHNAIFLSVIVVLFIIIIFGEVYSRLTYNNWGYEFTSTNLKVEKGIIWKKYSNIPYARVQNVDIHRGILARMLGFSSVMIQTAGMSYNPRSGGINAEGYIPAVIPEKAEKIREFLMKKISNKHKNNQGL